MSGNMSTKLFLAAFVGLLLVSSMLELRVAASHFRYGTIAWWVDNPAQPNVVTFRVNTAYRDTFFNVDTGSTFNPGSLCYRNGTNCVSMVSVKQSEFTADDWMTGQFGPGLGLATTYTHTYPATDGVYIVDHTSNARIGALSNNANKNWRITALVKIRMTAGQAILRSPVANTLPIVPVRWGVSAATYQLSATPISPGAITLFSMATGAQMGGTNLVHPGTLSAVDPTTGILTMNTANLAKNSLWCTQQIITDQATGVYVPIDYIIQVKEFNTYCNPACSNGMVPCGSEANCFNCGSASPKCTSSIPQLVIAGTGKGSVAAPGQLVPDRLNTINAAPDVPLRIDIVAHDALVTDPSKPVTIYLGSTPPGASISSQISCTGSACSCPTCNNPKVRSLTWTPTGANLGDYTTCVGVRSFDGTELSYSQHCFTISVARQPCGVGSLPGSCSGGIPTGVSPCICTCPANYDPSANCLQCTSNAYGPQCTTCPVCQNGGTCDNGILGSGVCFCPPGFTGLRCETTVNQRCGISGNSLLRSTTSGISRLNPVSALLLVATSNYNFDFTLSTPAKPTIDIVIAQDISSGITIDDTNALNTYITTFLSNLAANTATSPLVGIATFGSGAASYRRVAALTADGSVLKQKTSALFPTTPPAASDKAASMGAAKAVAQDNGYGWRTEAFKIVLILTAKNYEDVTLGDISTALIQENVVPIFLHRNAVNYAGAITTFGFGTSNSGLGTPQNNWATLADAAVRSVITQVIVKAYDPSAVVAAPPVASTVTLGSSKTVTVGFRTVTLAGNAPLPVALVNVMGWGQSEVTTAINRPPVASATTVTGNENQVIPFTVVASDSDNNIIYTRFNAPLPTGGLIQTTGGVNVDTATFYAATSFRFVPTTNFYSVGGPAGGRSADPTFTFTVNDGCTTSGNGNGVIKVNFVNQPPVATDFSVANVNENNNVNIDWNTGARISDVDNALTDLVIKIVSLPAGIGKLQSGGNNVVAGQELPSRTVTFVPNANEWGSVSFTYQARDPSNAYSATKTVTFSIINVNQAPILRTTVSGVPALELESGCHLEGFNKCPSVSFIMEDYDVADQLTLTFTKINCGPSSTSTCARSIYLARTPTSSASLNASSDAGIGAAGQAAIYPGIGTFIVGPTTNAQWGPLVQSQPISKFLQRTIVTVYIDFYRGGGQNLVFDNSETQLIMTMTVSDGQASSSQLTLTVAGTNLKAPRPLAAGPFSTSEDPVSPLTFTITANPSATQPGTSTESEWINNVLLQTAQPVVVADNTFSQVNAPGTIAVGTKTVTGSGATAEIDYTMTYTPAANFHGKVSFEVVWYFSLNGQSIDTPAPAVTYIINVTPVNDPPTTSGFNVKTLQDTPVVIDSFSATSIDWAQTSLSLVINTLPANGSFVLASNDSPITANQVIAGGPSNWKVKYTPPAMGFSVPDTAALHSFTFSIRDSNTPTAGTSNPATCNIIVQNVDDPPYSANIVTGTDENAPVQIFFDLFDTDGAADVALTRAIIYIPSSFKGRLFFDQAMTQNVTDGSTTGQGPANAFVWYMPPFDEFSYSTPSYTNQNPMDSFTFKLETMNAQQLQSTDIYTANIHVKFVNQPPRFVGLLRRVMDEDTTDDVVLFGRDDNTANNAITAYIITLPQKGVLRDGVNDEAMPIMTTPYLVTSEGRSVSFTPGLHENGNDYASFTFKLVDTMGAEATYTIIYDVTPVNTPPDVVPINFNRTVLINEGESTTLLFSASDVDDATSTLNAAITTIPLRGEVFVCQTEAAPCPYDNATAPLALTLGAQMINLTKLSDGRWGVHFVPERLQGFASYTLAFKAIDPHGALSVQAPVTVRVLPVNDPPVLFVPQEQYDTFVNQAVNLFPNVSDPDAGVVPIQVQILIQSGGPAGTALDLTDGRAFVPRADAFRNRTDAPFCSRSEDKTNITCTAPQAILSDIINTLQFIPTDESNPTTIVLTVDDLGAGGNPNDITNPHLTDTKTVIVTVQPPAAIEEGTNNLTWAAVAAAGAGVLLAVVLGVIIRRKFKRVDEEYFDAFGSGNNDGVLSSPLYEEGFNKGENPLFDGRRTVEIAGAADAQGAL